MAHPSINGWFNGKLDFPLPGQNENLVCPEIGDTNTLLWKKRYDNVINHDKSLDFRVPYMFTEIY